MNEEPKPLSGYLWVVIDLFLIAFSILSIVTLRVDYFYNQTKRVSNN